MPDKNSRLTYRWMEQVWNQGREDAIDEMMDQNVVVHGIDDVKETGITAFKQFFQGFRSQFPQINIDVQDVVSERDMETCRCIVDATTAGGQKVQFSGMTVTRIVNGKIVEGWNNFDFLAMYKQMGFKLAPAEEQPIV